MKKLALTLTLATAVCAAFAAPEKFLGWQTTDTAAIKAQLAKPTNESVRAYHKVWYTFMLARLEAPETVDTLAKCEAVMAGAIAKYGVKMTVPGSVLGVLRGTGDKRFLAEISKDPKYTGTSYYKQYYVLAGLVPAGTAEKRDAALDVAEELIKSGKAAAVAALVDKYVEFSLDDDDAAVVKGLQKLYRLAAPKLTAAANDPWKPVVAKLQLALKSRGAEVK